MPQVENLSSGKRKGCQMGIPVKKLVRGGAINYQAKRLAIAIKP